jgi:hypothetical protein
MQNDGYNDCEVQNLLRQGQKEIEKEKRKPDYIPPFMEYLLHTNIITLPPKDLLSAITEKGLLFKPNIKERVVIIIGSFLYEIGAIIGSRFRDNTKELIGIMKFNRETQKKYLLETQEKIKWQLNVYRRCLHHEPWSFFDFIWYMQVGRCMYEVYKDKDNDYVDELFKVNTYLIVSDKVSGFRETIFSYENSIFSAEIKLETLGNEGIIFGATFPDFTDEIERKQYTSEETIWNLIKPILGKKIVQPLPFNYETLIQIAISELTNYVNRYSPNLSTPLGLNQSNNTSAIQQTDTYAMHALCNNCDFKSEVIIVKNKLLSETDCPKCGCKELIKDT